MKPCIVCGTEFEDTTFNQNKGSEMKLNKILFFIFLFCVLISVTYAVEYTATTGYVGDGSSGWDINWAGERFCTNTSIAIVSIVKEAGGTNPATQCAIFLGVNKVANGSYSGNICNLTSPYTTDDDSCYNILNNRNGASWDGRYHDLIAHPIHTTIGDYTTHLYYKPDLTLIESGVNTIYEIYYFNYTLINSTALLDNCSNYIYNTLNITILEDINNNLEKTNIKSYFEVWSGNRLNFKSYNFSWTDTNKSNICLIYNDSILLSDAQLEYGGTGDYAKKTYYLTNFNLTNNTQQLVLYLTPNTTQVTFTVIDQDDTPISGIYINILKYDFGTNTYTTSEIIKTDEQGIAIGNVVLTTQWYKFILIYNGANVFESEPVKITSTTRNFRINLLDNFFDYYTEWGDIHTSLTFTNSTGNFAYTFINDLGTSITACLNVVRLTSMTDTLINETCVTSSIGTILVNVGTKGDYTFKAVGSVQASPEWITDVLFASYETGYRKYGKDGIFVAFLVRLTLVMVGIWNPMVAIILLVLADFGMISMGLYTMNWKTFMFYAILAGITIYRISRR